MCSAPVDKRAERRRIVSNPNFNRRGFAETKEEVEGMMVDEFKSDLVAKIRAAGNTFVNEDVTIKLAEVLLCVRTHARRCTL